MKRTFITTMPDHIGAFLKASKCLASLGINITRVSYNKAVDSHTLFIDAEGSPEQLDEADRQLTQIGYLQGNSTQKSIVLLEFRLRDVPGSVTDVLNLISQYHFNISYISSQENGSSYQYFKMGLFVEDYDKVARFIRDAEELCRVRELFMRRFFTQQFKRTAGPDGIQAGIISLSARNSWQMPADINGKLFISKE